MCHFISLFKEFDSEVDARLSEPQEEKSSVSLKYTLDTAPSTTVHHLHKRSKSHKWEYL